MKSVALRTSAVVAIHLIAMSLLCGLGNASVPTISAHDLRNLQLSGDPRLLIVDVRYPGDFLNGHIQSARNVALSNVGSAGLPRDARIVVYCTEPSCSMSTSAAERLAALGYPNIFLLDGGFAQWIKQGYPVQVGASTAPRPQPVSISARDARIRIDRDLIFVLDVRPPVEYSAGHLPKARNISLEQLDSSMNTLPKDADILVYDRDAARSRQAFEKLAQAGYRAVELSGGLAGWVARKEALEIK